MSDSRNGSSPDTAAPLTVFDLHRRADRRGQLGRTPRLAAEAFVIAWRSSPRHLVATLGLQVASGLGVGGLLLVARRIMQELVAVSHGGPVSALYVPFALLILATAGLGVIRALTNHQQSLLAEMVARHAYDRILSAANAVDYRKFETSDFYDQLQRARTSGEYRTIEMVNSISSLLSALLTTLGIAAVLALLHPLLLACVLVAAVPALLAALRNSRARYWFDYAMTPESRERAYIVELLTERPSVKEVRLFDLGGFLQGRYRELTDERLRQLRIFLRKRFFVTLVGTLGGAVGTGIAFGTLLLLLVDKRIGVATALTAGVAMQQLGARLTTITSSFTKLIESGMFIDDYKKFLALAGEGVARASQERSAARAPRSRRFSGLEVERASFTYPNAMAPALDDVSLEVAPGEIVALVGENGSGKTTLVKLICQLYEPAAGRILWNGVDARTLAPEEIQSEITVLFQDFIQYHLSARDNIAFGDIARRESHDDVVRAAVQAGADRFLSRLPRAYDTRLGLQFYGGHELSVGQWQRLALARAFFRAGDFLILDEPTASLDPRAERDLFEQMRALSAGRSVLLISHRFSSVRTADRIYVLAHGRIVESGTHEELVAQGGHYAELFELQAAAYLERVPAR